MFRKFINHACGEFRLHHLHNDTKFQNYHKHHKKN